MILRLLIYSALCGLLLSWGGHGQGGHVMASWWFQGILVTLALFPVIHFGPRDFLRRFLAVWMVLALVSCFCPWLEGRVYLPLADWNQTHALFVGLVLYTAMALLIAALPGFFELISEGGDTPVSRDADGIVLVMLAGGVAYLLMHWIAGALFSRFTQPYYQSVLELRVGLDAVAKIGARLYLIEFGRGALMALAIVPAVAMVRVDRTKAAIIGASVLWLAGGLALQVAPNPLVPKHLRWLLVWQSLLQNAPLGVLTAFIVRKVEEPAEEQPEQAASTTA